jgi:hypothetical protein
MATNEPLSADVVASAMRNEGQVLGSGSFNLTPAETTAKLAEMKIARDARELGPPPAPPSSAGPPGSAAFAKARLEQFKSDPALRDQLLKGNAPVLREWHDLHRIIVDAGESSPIGVETTSGNEVTRNEYETALDGLREGSLPWDSEEYVRDLDAGRRTDRPTQGDALLMREARDRLMRDPDRRQKYLNNDFATRQLISAFNRVIALAAEDGRPASTEAHEFLQKLGLR